MAGKFSHINDDLIRASFAPRDAWPYRYKFDRFYIALPPERIKRDEKRLKSIFNAAAKRSPTFRKQMAWAKAHDVKYYVDYQSVSLGHYTPGTGAIGIAVGQFDKSLAQIASVVAHETRHAWQDAEGFNFNGWDFASDFKVTALVEADAASHEKTVMEEVIRSKFQRITKALSKQLMWDGFSGWFASDAPPKYGNALAKNKAWIYGMTTEPPTNRNYDFCDGGYSYRRFDLDCPSSKMRLGTMLDGSSYFQMDKIGNLLNEVDKTDAALKFYDKTLEKPSDLVLAICKKEQEKRHHKMGW